MPPLESYAEAKRKKEIRDTVETQSISQRMSGIGAGSSRLRDSLVAQMVEYALGDLEVLIPALGDLLETPLASRLSRSWSMKEKAANT